ncbi:MAG TPA: FAD-dependent thymidylate synthase [candidate division Zixibacteria bacterium]|nr:FAD-dependent thymidylate synthase [candidate division Zixibacteria bacterium]
MTVDKLETVATTVDMNDREQMTGVFAPRECLDHGFVRLVDYMGDDSAIVQAARVSYGRGTKKRSDDRGLIRYLMRHSHTTPFEMVEFKFHVKLPIFVARQWIRHRTANVNEYSARYSVMEDEFYIPEGDQILYQSSSNKQGRGGEQPPAELREQFRELLEQTQKQSYAEYQDLIGKNLTRELARIHLPVSVYTQWYWKIDLHNLFHFLRLRVDDHAQYEIRVYAQAMAEIVKEIVPLAFEAFDDYTLNAVKLTKPELKLMRWIFDGFDCEESDAEKAGLSKREYQELREKLAKIRSL